MLQPKHNIVQSTLVHAIEGLSIDLFYIKPNAHENGLNSQSKNPPLLFGSTLHFFGLLMR